MRRSLRRHHANRSRRRVLRILGYVDPDWRHDADGWWRLRDVLGQMWGREYWTARPGNPAPPGRISKQFTHRRERRAEERMLHAVRVRELARPV